MSDDTLIGTLEGPPAREPARAYPQGPRLNHPPRRCSSRCVWSTSPRAYFCTLAS